MHITHRYIPRLTRLFAAAGIMALPTFASAVLVDFEGLIPGSVNGQAGWTVEDEFGFGLTAYDQEVVDDGTGNMAWRVSNAVTSGGFSNQPNTQSSPQVAGESGSALWNDRGPDHTAPLSPPNPGGTATTSRFHSSFSFRSVTGAPQSNLGITLSPTARQSSWRNGYLAINDNGATGFDISFYETGSLADPFGPSATNPTIATDLSYSDWHTIDLYIDFVDGSLPSTFGNDVVQVFVDGNLVHTGSTWESYYDTDPGTRVQPGSSLKQAVDALMFRISGTAAPGNAGNGFYIDNVLVENFAAIPEPSRAALLALGVILPILRRRRVR